MKSTTRKPRPGRFKIHGKWKTREFDVWQGMIDRCRHHPLYAGRGLTVCERWRSSFQAFLDDMGERPSPDHSLDRIHNKGGYSCGQYDLCPDCAATGRPANVRWATDAEQNRNRSDNRWVTFRGETLCVTDWARQIGVSKETLRQRLSRGWSVERALTEPLNR